MSANFDRFLQSNFFGSSYDAFHDGVDLPLLLALHGDELAQAEDMLLKTLPDSRAIQGLGAIRSQKAAQPIRVLLNDPSVAVTAATALYHITGDTSVVHVFIDTLNNHGAGKYSRIGAAKMLRDFPTQAAVEALLGTWGDPEVSVSQEGTNSLIVIYRRLHKGDSAETPHVLNERERYDIIEAIRQMVKDGTLSES